MWKKLCGALLTLTMLLALLPCRAEAVQLSAAAAILMDADSGEILFEKDAGRCMRIASTTKIMTALVALERAKLTDTITVTASHMVEGSSMYLKPGETVTVEELLYGLMLCSGNDAALALADCCGGLDAFVQAMNEKAAALGMKDTSFANPNGLDDENHYSTAQDMAVLAAYAAEDPTVRRICSTKTATVGGRSMTNHNKLLSMEDGCIGLKTGYTRAAGRTLVSCAQRNGQRLVAVTLQDGNDWADHQSLYDYGFSAYPASRAAVLGETVERAAVTGGSQSTVALVAAAGFSWPLGEGEKLTAEIETDGPLQAPLTAGSRVGQAVFLVNGQEVGRVDLLCGETILPAAGLALETLKRGLN